MKNSFHRFNAKKEATTRNTKAALKKKTSLLVLIAMLLFSEIMVPLSSASVEAPSGKDIIYVEPSSIKRVTKFLAIGEKIEGKITVNDEDNNIIFKLYDPAGNLCLWLDVLHSSEFSWGPVNFDGDYLLAFDNLYDSSNRKTVSLEFRITSTLANSFTTATFLVIAAILVTIIVTVVIFLRRRGVREILPH